MSDGRAFPAKHLDSRMQARLNAAIIERAEAVEKYSVGDFIDWFHESYNVRVTFNQVSLATERLSYRWPDVFLPASQEERGINVKNAKQRTHVESADTKSLEQIMQRMDMLQKTLGDVMNQLNKLVVSNE
jgi:hypothetical protein